MDMQNDTNVAEKAPTSEDLRKALLDRANEYAEATKSPKGKKTSLSTISDYCAGDGKFLLDVERGNNFTVERYQKAMDWFDAHWPQERVA